MTKPHRPTKSRKSNFGKPRKYPKRGRFKPIPTVYQDVEFKSKLEARWAFVMTHLGIQWMYEPVLFKTKIGRGRKFEYLYYRPDFYVIVRPDPSDPKHLGSSWWLECKPTKPTRQELAKAGIVSESGQKLFFAIGNPTVDHSVATPNAFTGAGAFERYNITTLFHTDIPTLAQYISESTTYFR